MKTNGVSITEKMGGQRSAGAMSRLGMAERGGFEPPVRFYPYNGLANRRFRPLSHLSSLDLLLLSESGTDYGRVKPKSGKTMRNPGRF
jgi:hypothetical protein